MSARARTYWTEGFAGGAPRDRYSDAKGPLSAATLSLFSPDLSRYFYFAHIAQTPEGWWHVVLDTREHPIQRDHSSYNFDWENPIVFPSKKEAKAYAETLASLI